MKSSESSIRVQYRCFSCGRPCKNKISLYSHLRFCYWHSVFKNDLTKAPFYQESPNSKQLRYYYRNRAEINKKSKVRYAENKPLQRTKIRLPRTLK